MFFVDLSLGSYSLSPHFAYLHCFSTGSQSFEFVDNPLINRVSLTSYNPLSVLEVSPIGFKARHSGKVFLMGNPIWTLGFSVET